MDCDIVVVGAGAAGLLAARDLARGGRRVTLLEARDRVGGRLREERDSRAGAPVELGAEFVHGRPKITLRLLAEIGQNVISREDGERDERFERAHDLIVRGAQSAPDETVDALLTRLQAEGADADAVGEARALVQGFDAADPARVSARAVAREWSGDASASGAQGRPARGYAPLVAHLRDSLDPALVTIRTNAVATNVSRDARGVRVSYRNGDHDATVSARRAIVTVPAGVLRAPHGAEGAIAFDPPLPEATRRAIASIEMGPVVKVVLVFNAPFWDQYAAFVGADADFAVYWTQEPVRANTLVAWVGGPQAERLAHLDSGALIERALAGAGRAFCAEARARSTFVAGYVHDWQRDPYARGAYSYVLAGGDGAREILAQPVDGVLWFAGEAAASDAEGGTVAGALESGARAAAEILAAG